MPKKNPIVSIIIPVVNNLQYNRECIESIEKYTRDVSHEIIVVDNHSTDGSHEYFQSLGDKVRLICNNEIKTFAQSNNQAAREAQGEYLALLNNDAYVTQGWLSAMLDSIRSDPTIGIVGNKHLFPINRRVSHAGGVFSDSGPEHIYLYYDSNLPFLNEDRDYQWVTAACLLIPKKLYFEVDGFCEEYRNSYEDVDLCLRVKDRGYKIHYCPKSVIYHYGLRTPGRLDNENQNQVLFNEKWGANIRLDKEDCFIENGLPEALGPDYRLEQYLFHSSRLHSHNKNLEKELGRLQAHVIAQNDLISARGNHIEAQDRHIEGLNKHVEGLNEHIGAQNNHIQGLENNIGIIANDLELHKVHIDHLEKANIALNNLADDYKKHIEAIYNTFSWRITKPIRSVKQFLTKKS